MKKYKIRKYKIWSRVLLPGHQPSDSCGGLSKPVPSCHFSEAREFVKVDDRTPQWVSEPLSWNVLMAWSAVFSSFSREVMF